jgi:hypothetical protein
MSPESPNPGIPNPKIYKGKIGFTETRTPIPKKDGPLRKEVRGDARTITKLEVNEKKEVEDLEKIVRFVFALLLSRPRMGNAGLMIDKRASLGSKYSLLNRLSVPGGPGKGLERVISKDEGCIRCERVGITPGKSNLTRSSLYRTRCILYH